MPVEPPFDYDDAMERAEKCRARANHWYALEEERERRHRAVLQSHLRQHWWEFWKAKHNPGVEMALAMDFDLSVQLRANANTEYAVAIGDSKWFMDWARAYGSGGRRRQVPVRPPGQPSHADREATEAP